MTALQTCRMMTEQFVKIIQMHWCFSGVFPHRLSNVKTMAGHLCENTDFFILVYQGRSGPTCQNFLAIPLEPQPR